MKEEKKLDRLDLLEMQVLQFKQQILDKDKEILELKKSLMEHDKRTLLTNITRKYDIDSSKNFITIDATKGTVVIKDKAED